LYLVGLFFMNCTMMYTDPRTSRIFGSRNSQWSCCLAKWLCCMG